MASFQPPSECDKCGGPLQEGFTVDNNKIVPSGYPAFGENVKLGGSHSWWQIVPAQEGQTAGVFAPETFKLDRVLAGERIQVFTYRCEHCGFLEAYAPKL